MSKPIKVMRAFVAVLAAAAFAATSVQARDFTYDEKVNAELARKLNIPVFFALPASARLDLPPKTVDVPGARFVDFKHPGGKDAKGDVGLRIVRIKRAGMAQALGKSGLIQTGDIMLTFRTEWGGAGPYPNIQMGISHTGVAYVKDGVLHNLDNPMDNVYLGPGYRAELGSEHYSTLNYLHIIRPRGLTDAQRANILAWATRLNTGAPRIYPKQISFNTDYNAPKYQSGKPVEFVQHLGQSALGQNPSGNVALFCSEFAWSLLSLRDCDPGKTAEVFKGSRVPSCVREPMKPMRVTGDYMSRRGRWSYSGLADGPLMVIDALKLPAEQRDKLIHSVFIENPAGLSKMSVGHRKVATDMKPKFAPLEKYYLGVYNGIWGASVEARMIGAAFNKAIPENYSPTSYLINTLLPPSNSNRSMDYVATILIE
jgi:hypothetical protein